MSKKARTNHKVTDVLATKATSVLLNKHFHFEISNGQLDVIVRNNSQNNSFDLTDIMKVGSRNNSKRGFLFVSKILGKHISNNPKTINQYTQKLTNKIKNKIKNDNVLFVGFAETATCLSQLIFEQYVSFYKKHRNHYSNNTNDTSKQEQGLTKSIKSVKLENLLEKKIQYIHTTRYLLDKSLLINFQEAHSHAPNHIVYDTINDKDKIQSLVLIDDELSTGKTCINFIKELIETNQFTSLKTIYIVSITNWIDDNRIREMKKEIGSQYHVNLNFVDLVKGSFEFTPNEQYKQNIIEAKNNNSNVNKQNNNIKNNVIKSNFKNRLGCNLSDIQYVEQYVSNNIHLLTDNISKEDKNILILGTGEFMYIPFKFAQFLENKFMHKNIFFQSTTRSPVIVNENEAIKSSVSFKDNYNDNIDNYIYNLDVNQYDKIFILYETDEKYNIDLRSNNTDRNCIFHINLE